MGILKKYAGVLKAYRLRQLRKNLANILWDMRQHDNAGYRKVKILEMPYVKEYYFGDIAKVIMDVGHILECYTNFEVDAILDLALMISQRIIDQYE